MSAPSSTFQSGEQPESWEDQIAVGYRDERVLPRGGCGFRWAHPDAPKHGKYACEKPAGHDGKHACGNATWPWSKRSPAPEIPSGITRAFNAGYEQGVKETLARVELAIREVMHSYPETGSAWLHAEALEARVRQLGVR